jgi:hypothetical protein
MKALVYLVACTLKNTILETIRKPARLVVTILTIAFIGGLVVLSNVTNKEGTGALELYWLKVILFAFILFLGGISLKTGITSGNTIFSMSDVNLLFVSPLSPRRILIYGIVSMMKTALLSGIFILFQSSTFKTAFGLGFSAVLIVLLCYTLALMMTQLLSLLLYILTNSRPNRKRLVALVAVALCIPLVVVFLVNYSTSGDYKLALSLAAASPALSWFPIAGWASEFALALITGQYGTVVLYLAVSLAFCVLVVVLINLSKVDYYEDVLVASETAFEKQRALKEGNLSSVTDDKKKVRVKKTGITGRGAATLFYKHLRESFRQNRLGLWGPGSIIYVVLTVVLSIIMRYSNGLLLVLTQGLMWAQVFLIGMGRGLKELYMHYIYLIPESSLSKIVWSSFETVFKVIVEAIVVFTIVGIISRSPIMDIFGAFLVYTLFNFLLLGINYASLRWSGGSMNAGLAIVLYMVIVIVTLLPGLVPAIILGSSLPTHLSWLGYFVLAGWELIAGFGYFALSNGILHKCDMSTMQQIER